MSTASPPALERRGPPKWLKVVVIIALVGANLAVLAALWGIRIGQGFLATVGADPDVARVLDSGVGDDITVLIVGSDSRAGLDNLTNFGSIGGQRSDVIMLAKFTADADNVQILSIPRDLYVDIPGFGDNRINAAYASGGSALLVETIKSNLDVEVNHSVEIGFAGFADLIDEIGGIRITFPHAARDAKSGLDVPAGSQTLDGDMALAYARSRNYQEYQNGIWVSVTAGDIGRTERQRRVVGAMISKLRSPASIAEAGRLARSAAEHVTIDSSLAESSLARLAWNFRGVLTGSVDGAALPATAASIDGRSVLLLDQPRAAEVLAKFRSGMPFNQTPIRVEVLNGNGVTGSASQMSEMLERRGIAVLSFGNADRTDFETTTVFVPKGSAVGDEIVDAIGFGVVRVGNVENGYDAVVIVGADAP